MDEAPIECRSEEGITIGLIDAILTAAEALKSRDLSSDGTQEAIEDLRSCKALRDLLVNDNFRKDRDAIHQMLSLELEMMPKGHGR